MEGLFQRFRVRIATILFLCGLLCGMLLWPPQTVAAMSRYGSQGEEVRAIQTKLQSLGYNIGTIDGQYGSKTQEAVRQFQRDRGLGADGIAGSKTLAALGIESKVGTGDLDMDLLARTVSAESKGESYIGQVAVAAVILNRIEHPSFPNTLSGVVYQAGAFEPVRNGTINLPATESAVRAAMEAIAGNDPTCGALYFFNPAKTDNAWMRTRPVVAIIGEHHFCK